MLSFPLLKTTHGGHNFAQCTEEASLFFWEKVLFFLAISFQPAGMPTESFALPGCQSGKLLLEQRVRKAQRCSFLPPEIRSQPRMRLC